MGLGCQVREGEDAILVAAVRHKVGQAARGLMRNLGIVLGGVKAGSVQVRAMCPHQLQGQDCVYFGHGATQYYAPCLRYGVGVQPTMHVPDHMM